MDDSFVFDHQHFSPEDIPPPDPNVIILVRVTAKLDRKIDLPTLEDTINSQEFYDEYDNFSSEFVEALAQVVVAGLHSVMKTYTYQEEMEGVIDLTSIAFKFLPHPFKPEVNNAQDRE